MNIINKIDKILSKVSINFVRVLFAIIVIGMFFVNSVYLYTDTPSFRSNNIWNYVGILANIIGFCLIILLNNFLNRKLKNQKYINLIFLIIYFIAQIIFLKLVPLKPFSDMYYVAEIALSNFTNEMEYLQICTNNLPIVLIFNFIFRITTYNVFVLKVLNIVCNIITVYFSYKTYKNIYQEDNKLVVILGVCLIPTFLYVNHIYNDVISIALIVVSLYYITKSHTNKLEKIITSILLFLQFIIRPSGIIFVIAAIMYYFFKDKNIKMIFSILVMFLLLNFLYMQIDKAIIPKSNETKEYPVWSYIQMGINESEFGFQDASHSTEWKAEDVKNRIVELGPFRLIKLLFKKEFWLWTEGTYQVQRYAFGDGTEGLFYEETVLTKQLYDVENSNFRKALDYIIKGQYFILILLALADLFIQDKKEETKNKKDLLLYVIVGIFCFYLIWEIKSRYIYCLYPIFLILSASGINKIINNIKIKKG